MSGISSYLLMGNTVEQNIQLISQGKFITEELDKALKSKPANIDRNRSMFLATTIMLLFSAIIAGVITSRPVGLSFVAVAMITFLQFASYDNEYTEYEKRVGAAAIVLTEIYKKVARYFDDRRIAITAKMLNDGSSEGLNKLEPASHITQRVEKEPENVRELANKIRSFKDSNATMLLLPKTSECDRLKLAWESLSALNQIKTSREA